MEERSPAYMAMMNVMRKGATTQKVTQDMAESVREALEASANAAERELAEALVVMLERIAETHKIVTPDGPPPSSSDDLFFDPADVKPIKTEPPEEGIVQQINILPKPRRRRRKVNSAVDDAYEQQLLQRLMDPSINANICTICNVNSVPEYVRPAECEECVSRHRKELRSVIFEDIDAQFGKVRPLPELPPQAQISLGFASGIGIRSRPKKKQPLSFAEIDAQFGKVPDSEPSMLPEQPMMSVAKATGMGARTRCKIPRLRD